MNTDYKSRFTAACVFHLSVAMLLCGCRVASERKVIGYFGPIDSLQTVVNDVNANNEKLPTLRGEGSFEAWLREDRSQKEQFVNGDLTLLYSQPQSIRIIAKKPAAGTIMEIAGNDERYWVILPTQDSLQWGSYQNLSKVDPKRVPIRPDLVLEVLGILPIDSNLMQSPVPTLRFNSDRDMYMVVWNAPIRTQWVAVKEIWYDRKTKLPTMVVLYDPDGKMVLVAQLSEHKAVEIEGKPEAQWPKVATKYVLNFPQIGSKFNFDLKTDLALNRGGAPNPRTFAFPNLNNAGVSHIIALDEPAAR